MARLHGAWLHGLAWPDLTEVDDDRYQPDAIVIYVHGGDVHVARLSCCFCGRTILTILHRYLHLPLSSTASTWRRWSILHLGTSDISRYINRVIVAYYSTCQAWAVGVVHRWRSYMEITCWASRPSIGRSDLD